MSEQEHWKGIGKLIEECGEVLQLAGKAIPFPSEPHPDGKGTIAERLPMELADLLAAIDYVISVNRLDHHAIQARRTEKIDKFLKWGLTGVKP